MSTTTQLTPGIYHIVVVGGEFDSHRLTDGKYVTVLPPIHNNPKQEVIHYFHKELECLSLTCPFYLVAN